MSVKYIKGTDKAIIGVDNLHYAKNLTDAPTELTYGEMNSLPNTISISVAMNSTTETLYADNKAAIVYSSMGNVEVTMERTHLPEEVLAEWLGSTMEGGTRHINQEQNSPYYGIAWRNVFSDGTYAYIKLYKGKFTEPDKSVTTKGESIEFQTQEIVGNFVSTIYQHGVTEGAKKKNISLLMSVADEGSEAYTDEGVTWFDTMFEPAAP